MPELKIILNYQESQFQIDYPSNDINKSFMNGANNLINYIPLQQNNLENNQNITCTHKCLHNHSIFIVPFTKTYL